MPTSDVRKLMREATSGEAIVETEKGKLPTWEFLRTERDRAFEEGRLFGRKERTTEIRQEAIKLVRLSHGHEQAGYLSVANAIDVLLKDEKSDE
jgi:hypothetical protein